MNKRTKKVGKRIKRLEAEIRTKTNIFEKNPSKGGTPASERIERLRSFVRMFAEPKFESENSVLKFIVKACIRVENSRKDVTLYITM